MIAKVTAVALALIIMLSAGVNEYAQGIEEIPDEEIEEILEEDPPVSEQEVITEPEETEIPEEEEKPEQAANAEQTQEPDGETAAADESPAEPEQGEDTPVIIAAAVTTNVEIMINPNASGEDGIISTGEIEIVNHSDYPIEAVMTGIAEDYGNVFVSFTNNTVQETSDIIDWKNLGTENTKKYIAFSVGGRDMYGTGMLLYITDMDKRESGDNERTVPLLIKTGYAWERAEEIKYTFEFLLEIKDYNIVASESLLDFGKVMNMPYQQPEPKLVTLTNTGTGKITLTQPVSQNYEISELTKNVLEEPGDTAQFTITPKAGLPGRNYNTTIEISGNYGARTVIFVEFEVVNPIYRLTANYTSFDFGVSPPDGEQPPGKIFSLTNTGNLPVEAEIITVPDGFTLTSSAQAMLLEPDDTVYYEVRPEAGLLSGRYVGTIWYRWSNGWDSMVTLTYTVADAGFVIYADRNSQYNLNADFPAGSGVLWGDNTNSRFSTERKSASHNYSTSGYKYIYLWGDVDNIQMSHDTVEILFMRDNMVMQFLKSSSVTFGPLLQNKKIDVWLLGGGAHGDWGEGLTLGYKKGGWGGASGHVVNEFGIDVSRFPECNELIVGLGGVVPSPVWTYSPGGTSSFLGIDAPGGYMQDQGGVRGGDGGDPDNNVAGDGQDASENPEARPFRTGTDYYGAGGGGGSASHNYTDSGNGGSGAGGNGGAGGVTYNWGGRALDNSGSGGGGGGASSGTGSVNRYGGNGGSGRVHIRFNNGE